MPNEKLHHYDPNYPYENQNITIDENTGSGYPILEAVYNAALFPEAIRNNIDLEQLKPYH